jgi:hypothetical protein
MDHDAVTVVTPTLSVTTADTSASREVLGGHEMELPSSSQISPGKATGFEICGAVESGAVVLVVVVGGVVVLELLVVLVVVVGGVVVLELLVVLELVVDVLPCSVVVVDPGAVVVVVPGAMVVVVVKSVTCNGPSVGSQSTIGSPSAASSSWTSPAGTQTVRDGEVTSRTSIQSPDWSRPVAYTREPWR